ncbi:MAG TPA: cysteine--tRNA ligase [Candidatus Limnocylindrales bacterium]|nr:cysteine--tRNA ligase [Candidatus Limnocylindrales bacterium]
MERAKLAIKLYNTLSRCKEELEPAAPPLVTFYVCGPTVYDFIHIGNARVFIIFDVIRRYLEYRGYKVKLVQNYTDIDDKMITRASEQGISVPELAEIYIRAYEDDVAALRVRPADIRPRATEHIPQIIGLIERLLQNRAAYASSGDVYYDTASFPGYGQLSQQKQDELLAGARVEPGEKKRKPLDFALWKQKKQGEPSWDSPWGEGRPGWHIECSAMAAHYMNGTVDIHAGGADLVFPHHENEIAQTWSADGRLLAKYWMHAGYLKIEDRKMSKSLGNVRTVRRLLEEYDPLDLRFLILSAHYRSPLNFSADLITQARAGRDRLKEMIANMHSALGEAEEAASEQEEQLRTILREAGSRFTAAMDDDFNTADGLSVLFDLARRCNIYLKEAYPYNRALLEEALRFYTEVDAIFEILDISSPVELEKDITAAIARRDLARANKDWAASDRIRDELLARGVFLEDTPHGTRWKRKA